MGSQESGVPLTTAPGAGRQGWGCAGEVGPLRRTQAAGRGTRLPRLQHFGETPGQPTSHHGSRG